MTQVAQRISHEAPLQRSIHRLPAAARLVPAVLLAGVAALLAARWWSLAREVSAPATGGMLALPAADFLFQLPGLAVVGLLLVRSIALGPQQTAASHHLLRMASRWSYAWAAATVAALTGTASELTGVAVTSLWTREDAIAVLGRDDQAQAQIATLWVALVIALFGAKLASRFEVGALLLLTTAVILPSVQELPPGSPAHFGDHAVGQDLHWLAMAALAAQVVAAAIWVGGLLAIVLHLRVFAPQLRRALPRFGDVASVCVLLVGAAGLVQNALALPTGASLWQTTPGLILLAKGLALMLLATVGYRHRRRTMTMAGTGGVLALLMLLAGELVLMGATVSIALLLTTVS
ncbi:MAG TPA: CopD family protein [Propionibacteriaceae bacterium]|nr:CopD family protein [Propionibacteriaceae bacterium]